MVNRTIANSLNLDGIPLTSTGVVPVKKPALLLVNRPPTVNDNSKQYIIGTYWVVLNRALADPYQLWYLADNALGQPGNVPNATWLRIAAGGTKYLETIYTTNDMNTAIPVANQFIFTGVAPIAVTTPVNGGNTIEFTLTGGGTFADSFPTDAGIATPAAGVLNIWGSVGGAGHTGDNINTYAPGPANTVIVALNKALHMPYTTADGLQGIWYTGATGSPLAGGNRFISNLGTENTFVGENAGNLTLTTVSAVDNSAYGALSQQSLTTGAGNSSLGVGSLSDVSTGSDNTCIGFDAGEYIVSGSKNTILGSLSGTALTGAESNNVYIQNQGVLGESNTLRISSSGVGGYQVSTAYVGGIYGVTPSGTPQYVVVNSGDQLGSSSTSPGAGGVLVTTYSTPGTFTWTKNAHTKYVTVYGWGGGAGGGGGGWISGGGNAQGGGGGGAGGCFRYSSPGTFFGATETVVVGSGGAGGIGAVYATQIGGTGVAGTISSFGKVQTDTTSTGGTGGNPGVHQGVGGTGGNIWTDGMATAQTITSGGGYTGSPASANPVDMGTTSNLFLGATSGGFGGYATNSLYTTGGRGGNVVALDGSTIILAGAAAQVAPGNGNPGLTPPTSGGMVTGGSGGGGAAGAGALNVSGYVGGVGGQPGGGGGGGSGAAISGAGNVPVVAGGAGGAGGAGMVIVFEFLG